MLKEQAVTSIGSVIILYLLGTQCMTSLHKFRKCQESVLLILLYQQGLITAIITIPINKMVGISLIIRKKFSL